MSIAAQPRGAGWVRVLVALAALVAVALCALSVTAAAIPSDAPAEMAMSMGPTSTDEAPEQSTVCDGSCATEMAQCQQMAAAGVGLALLLLLVAPRLSWRLPRRPDLALSLHRRLDVVAPPWAVLSRLDLCIIRV